MLYKVKFIVYIKFIFPFMKRAIFAVWIAFEDRKIFEKFLNISVRLMDVILQNPVGASIKINTANGAFTKSSQTDV